MRLGYLAPLMLVALLAGCGGGGGGAGSAPIPPTPTPTPSPSATPQTSGSTTFTAQTQPTSVTLPPVGGFMGTLQMPAANAPTPLTLTDSTTPPTGAPALQVRTTSARTAATSGNTPLLYFTVATQSAVSFSGLPALTVTLPSSVNPSQSFFLAAYIPNDGWVTFAGPGLVQGTTLTITSPPGSITMDPGTMIAFSLYAGSVIGGGNPITASPAQVQLLDLTQTQSVTISDTATSPVLSLDSNSCNGIANVSSLSGSSFSVSAVALGTCSVIVTDNYSNSLTIPVSVTTTSVVIQ